MSKFIKGLVVGIAISGLAYYYLKEDDKEIALPDFKINDKNSNLIGTEKKEIEEANIEDEFITKNIKSEYVKEFEKNCNTIANKRLFSGIGIADAYFFRVLKDVSRDTDNIFFPDKISLKFIQDFNMFYNRISGKRDYRLTKFTQENNDTIKKGDKATCVNMFKDIVNDLSPNIKLETYGNYSKKMFAVTKDLLQGTSAFDEKEGKISKEFIKNTYYLIRNLKN